MISVIVDYHQVLLVAIIVATWLKKRELNSHKIIHLTAIHDIDKYTLLIIAIAVVLGCRVQMQAYLQELSFILRILWGFPRFFFRISILSRPT